MSTAETRAQQADQLVFGPFRLDVTAKRLWRGAQEIPLQPQPLAVLRCLVERGGRLVTKEELLEQAWPGTWVSKTALKVCVYAVRAALGDDVSAPRYVETVGRLGYRFLCADGARETEPATNEADARPVVARDQELDRLRQRLDLAHRGSRQVVFVTGDPGIGKTTVVDLLLASLQSEGSVSLGRGQCLEQYGEGEAYLPVLEALGQLCRGPRGRQVLGTLCRVAPTWVVQMPALVTEAELDGLQRKVAGATRDRMLREMAEALEALTAERSLVLVFEDLHWSDRSTVDLIAYLARRRDPARLLVIGTYRSADLVARDHPLKSVKEHLQAHGQCAELPLELLMEDDVATYVARRCAGPGAPPGLAQLVYRRSDGNPLFMVNLVDHYLRHEVREAEPHRGGSPDDVPESLQQVIEQQMATLPAEVRQALEVASVVGMEFAVAQIAAALDRRPDALEDACDELAHEGRFLREGGVATWPDGTVSGRYGFRHALYQSVLYRRLPEARRTRLHRAIGEWTEAAHGDRAVELAAVLAVHFERGRDVRRAVRYHRHAGENAVRRSAHHEALSHFTRGLELLETWPRSPERAREELRLHITVATLLMSTQPDTASGMGDAEARARELSERLGDPAERFAALRVSSALELLRGNLRVAREYAEQYVALAQGLEDLRPLVEARYALGAVMFYQGELHSARAQLEEGGAACDPWEHGPYAFPDVVDWGVFCLGHAAWTLWLLGYPDQALDRVRAAGERARQLGEPWTLGAALAFTSTLHQQRRDVRATAAEAEALIAVSAAQGYPHWALDGALKRGWALSKQGRAEEDVVEMRQRLADVRATGAAIVESYYVALVAEACARLRRPEEGLALLAERLATLETSEEHFYDAELHRLKGELLRQAARERKHGRADAEAEACFERALAIARAQGARSLELRAAMSLARLWRGQRKSAAARKLLGDLYGWFTEGFETADLRDAKALLDALVVPASGAPPGVSTRSSRLRTR